MRAAFAFILGLSLTVAAFEPLGMPSKGTSYYSGRVFGVSGLRSLPEPAADTFDEAGIVWGVAMFVGAMGFSIAILVLRTSKKPWPVRSTILGATIGFGLAGLLDGMCIHALRQRQLPSDQNSPGYVLCIVLWVAAVAGIALMVYLGRNEAKVAALPAGGFSQGDLQELMRQGKLSEEEYARCVASVAKARARRMLDMQKKSRNLSERPWFGLPGRRQINLNKPPRSDRFCLQCGYDLRATPDRCPECGTVPPKE